MKTQCQLWSVHHFPCAPYSLEEQTDSQLSSAVCGGHSGRPSVWLWLLPRRGAQGYSQDDGLLGEGKHVNRCVVSGNKPVDWSSTLAIAVTAHRP